MRPERGAALPCDHPAVVAAARGAWSDPDRVADRLIKACSGGPCVPGDLIAASWVFDPEWQNTVLVRHQRFQVWMPPGGRIEPDEDPLSAAQRELQEETGLDLEPYATDPVLLDEWIGESRNRERTETYGLTYVFVAPRSTELTGEPDQPAAWFPLPDRPTDAHPRHWARLVDFAAGRRS